MIVQELRLIQERHGYLPAEELRALSKRTGVPLHRLHEVASFFPHYRLQPGPAVDVKVCRDMACFLRRSPQLHRALEARANEMGGAVAVEGVSCLGQCDHAPAVAINDHVYWGMPESKLRAIMEAAAAKEPLPPQHADRSPQGWKIDVYDGKPAYTVVKQFVETRDGDRILRELEAANLRGMGGAGFPTFKKWAAVRATPGAEKYIVCNGDESEPGTFKDRELLRRTPHLVIEGMVLAGLVTGATRGWIYIRHEFEEEIEAVEEGIRQAREMGVVGPNVLGSGLAFELEVYVSPGGYICGEETALLEAMEDHRAEPRNKPPFPTTNGLFNKPTVINNVETLSWVPAIVLRGGAWYRDQGTNGATGLRFVSISGDVNRPGVYEVPFGQTVRELVMDTAGGMRDGQRLAAIAPSGPSGGFLPAVLKAENLPAKFVKDRLPAGATTYDVLDLPLDLGTLGAIGSMLGAAFVVVGDRTPIVEMALNCVRFFKNESCGKCVPCRVGSQKLTGMIEQMLNGQFPRELLGLVDELATAMYSTSICGLGQVAANPMTSVLRHFRGDLEKYLETTPAKQPAGKK
ncbi:MAG TPA: NADH-ubiquinone oxidoreductase-F iron-sulfur binding region domain-containing protein [Gemmataceae bacterium]|nr:NADH-ubiquinone oxidoreductase-F iron-sulfur binding region domain-containing protein [Gemmataceae bacterium]